MKISNEAKFPLFVVLPVFIGAFLLMNRHSALADNIGNAWFVVVGLLFVFTGVSPVAVAAWKWMKKNWF